MRIGIDLGGTKTEIVALSAQGGILYKKRVPTQRDSYENLIRMIAALVAEAEGETGRKGTVGVGIPGTISARTGRIKNANTQILNGQALDADLAAALSRPVRCVNDANCLAVSEAVDGAGAGSRVVFAVIIGTGSGAGLAVDGKVWNGRNLVAGEWGHNPLPWAGADEHPGPACWCGLSGCLETWVSGTGFEQDYARNLSRHGHSGPETRLRGAEIAARAAQGETAAMETLTAYTSRLGRGLAQVINLVDPDIIVLGGGMSNVDALYAGLPAVIRSHVFGREADTPVVKSLHGDSSGVRGAAWLWQDTRQMTGE